MISTLHYYNSYNPFVLDKEKIRERKTSSYRAYSNQFKNSEITYFLNKTLNDNVKSYMFELSSNFNGLKGVANRIYEKIYYNSPMENLEENIQEFTHTYNRFIGFLEENTENSGGFTGILQNAKNFIDENENILKEIGINVSPSGFLSMKEEKNGKNINKQNAKQFYLDFYDKMCAFMKEPMSNHMDFKDFSYYFNYSGDYNKNNSFKLIEQGLLVDIAL